VIYVRNTCYAGVNVVCKDSDDIVIIQLLKDYFGLKKDVYLVYSYVLPENSARLAYQSVHTFDRIEAHIADIVNQNSDARFLLVGDLNARTSDRFDYIVDDMSEHVPLPDDYIVDVPVCSRASRDTVINSNGTRLLELCKSTGLRIVNGRKGTDANIGHFTCITARGKSLVDYVVCSDQLLDNIISFNVGDIHPYSDHCAIDFNLAVAYNDPELVKRETVN
jgi:hypothetical protein